MRFLDRTSPVARLLATLVLVVPLTLTLDWVSATVALVLSVGLLLLDGLTLRSLWRRTWPLLLVAPLAGLSMLLYAEPSGRVYARFWLATISDGSIRLAVASVLRALATTVPVLAVFGTLEATSLADSLAQQLRLPSRFVIGSLAGLRTVGLFLTDWRALEQARRARGLGDGGRFRRWLSMAFALLVFALRRGGKLATAMEARGFGAGPRTWARRATWSWRDPVVVLVATLVTATAIAVAVWTGSYYSFWG